METRKSTKILSMLLAFAMVFTIGLSLNLTTAEASSTQLESSKRNVIYAYELADVQYPNMYTHIMLAFVKCDSSGNVITGDFSNSASEISSFKSSYPNVKVLVALGGAGGREDLTAVMKSSTKRATLVNSLASFVSTYHLDGIDLDWEYYDSEGYSECNYAYKKFAQALRAKSAMSGKLLTMAGQTSSSFYASSDIVYMMDNYLDFISVMTYDFDTSYANAAKVGYTGNFTRSKDTMAGYAAALGGSSSDKAKLNMGLPFYGLKYNVTSTSIDERGEQATTYRGKFSYDDIMAEVGSGTIIYKDSNGVAVYNSGSRLYTFDNANTVATKTTWVVNNGYGGMMAWQVSQDSTETLQKSVVNKLNAIAPAGSGSGSGSATINQTFDSLPTISSSRSSSASIGTWSFGTSSSGASHISSYRLSSTNGSSFKLVPTEGRYTIDLYIRIKNCSTSSSLSFDTRVNSSSMIQKIQAIEVLDDSGNVTKNIIPTGTTEYAMTTSFQTITTRSLGSSTGWIHIQYYANGATASDGIYIDNFKVQ